MKHIIFSFCLLFAANLAAQKIDRYLPISYSQRDPVNAPKVHASQLWFNTATSGLWKYDRTAGRWEDMDSQAYAEMGISNDTLSISFAATTADTLEGLTSGSLSGFTHNAEGGVLTYTGTQSKTFLVMYSASYTFAEAVPVWAYLQVSGTAKLLSRTRALPATAGNTVSVSGQTIVTLAPGQTVSLFFVPTAHTGTDALTVYECNVSLTEIK